MARDLQVTLVSRPVGEPKESDFRLSRSGAPAPARVRCWFAAFGARSTRTCGAVSAGAFVARPVEIGEVMTAQGVGEVVGAGRGRFAPASRVGQFGWQELAAAPRIMSAESTRKSRRSRPRFTCSG